MRHIVNFGLLFSFCTLAATGVLAFLRPFSLLTTRIHVVFGLTTAILVALHLAVRLKYFRTQLARDSNERSSKGRISRASLVAVVVVWAALLATAFYDWTPSSWLIDQGYESQHRAEIVRTSSSAGFLDSETQRIVSRRPGVDVDPQGANEDTRHASLSLKIQFAQSLDPVPVIAVWTETTSGTMIETIYLDSALAYSERPVWNGTETPRNRILPIWRGRFTAISGVEPSGEVDAFSGATARHSFTLDDYLTLGDENEFVVCVEVNQPADPNEHFADPEVGQPSLLYTALIELDSEQRYTVLNLTGHGGGAEESGAIQYDLANHTTAKNLIDLLLVRVAKSDSK